MSQEDIIAKRYAKGLAEHAIEAGKVEEVRADLARLADLVDPHSGDFSIPEFMDFLNTPVVTPGAKLEATDVILEKMGVGKIVSDFLNVLITRNRVGLMPQINRQFNLLAADLTREHVVTVHTARPLTDDQAKRLAASLERALGAKVRIAQRVEPALLAGARVEVDGKVMDGTVLGKLEGMRRKLSKV
jgi:F-type H+-transporting ATPase subunit delta